MSRIDTQRAQRLGSGVKMARVFRDPTSDTVEEQGLRFELWIAFEIENGRVRDAEVIKTEGLGHPFRELPVSAFDVYVAQQVILEIPSHRSNAPGHYRFADYFQDGAPFTVEEQPLMSLLHRQYESLHKNKPEKNPRAKVAIEEPAEARTEKETVAPSSNGSAKPKSQAAKHADDFLSGIDDLLGANPGQGIPTNPEQPRHL